MIAWEVVADNGGFSTLDFVGNLLAGTFPLVAWLGIIVVLAV